MNTISKSVASLGKIVSLDGHTTKMPNLAFCTAKLWFDKVYINQRKSSTGRKLQPQVVLIRNGKRKRLIADATTRNWLKLDEIPNKGSSGYVTLPAYIATDMT